MVQLSFLMRFKTKVYTKKVNFHFSTFMKLYILNISNKFVVNEYACGMDDMLHNIMHVSSILQGQFSRLISKPPMLQGSWLYLLSQSWQSYYHKLLKKHLRVAMLYWFKSLSHFPFWFPMESIRQLFNYLNLLVVLICQLLKYLLLINCQTFSSIVEYDVNFSCSFSILMLASPFGNIDADFSALDSEEKIGLCKSKA